MRKEPVKSSKQKFVDYGSIYATYKNKKEEDEIISYLKKKGPMRLDGSFINDEKTVSNTPKKVDLSGQKNVNTERKKVLKDIYSKFVASTTDHEILCIIEPYMYSKQYPKMKTDACRRLVLDRIRIGYMKNALSCKQNMNPFNHGADYLPDIPVNNYDFCYVCSRQGMVYDAFCVRYRAYHEHIPLCISCGGTLEQKGNVLFDTVGKLGYSNFIKKVLCLKEHVPNDVSSIISRYFYVLLDNVLIKK